MKNEKQTIIIVTAYGDDNYFQKQYEDIVGMYTSVKNAIKGAKQDGLTNRQIEYLNSINAFYLLDEAIKENKDGKCFQVEFEYEEDGRRKPCKSSYMFQSYNLN